jgi:hypothetical protein
MTSAIIEPAPANLDELFARLSAVNPFTDNRVNEPSADEVDVDGIHHAAFERLTALAVEARDQRRGIGAMLLGEAGIGKSHVLSRLARWAVHEGRACSVYLHNLQAGPEQLPRSLLRTVVSILTRGQARRFQTTALFQLATAFLSEALDHDTASFHPWPRVEAAYRRWIDSLSAAEPSRAALVDRTAYDVIYRFFQSAYRARTRKEDGIAALAVRWLSGESLDPDEARLLGLPPGRWRDEPRALADNQQVKQVLVAISRMALSRGQPFVLCFDQVDNLDTDQAGALARFIEALIDSAPNLLVVTAGIQATLLRWRTDKIIQDSAWDRLAQFEIGLHRLTSAEAGRIVAARLERFLAPFERLDAIASKRRDDRFFPLGQAWHAAFIRDRVEVRPRDAINWAREGWRREQETMRRDGGPAWLEAWGSETAPLPDGMPTPLPTETEIQAAIDRKVAEQIHEQIRLRHSEPEALPADADRLEELVAKLLRLCRDSGSLHGVIAVERPPRRSGQRPAHSLLVRRRAADGSVTTTGLLFMMASHGNETAAALRRLLEATPAPDCQFLVTDERRPMPFGDRGEERLDELKDREAPRFEHIELTFAQIAELDALTAVLGQAQSGDLEIELRPGQARPVTEQEVSAAYQRMGMYVNCPVLRNLLGSSPTDAAAHEHALAGPVVRPAAEL